MVKPFVLHKVAFCRPTEIGEFDSSAEGNKVLRKLGETLRGDGKSIVRFRNEYTLTCRYPTGQTDHFLVLPRE